MVEAQASVVHVPPPWDPPDFFSQPGLKAAQEHWFQTHGSHSRMVAEGRNAVGFMKSHVRRKLQREMGEDFKMYTGQTIGAQGEASKGIRGDLNGILEIVYHKVAPGKPIESPIQEDLTILSHPLGGLEVCFAMGFYYTTLLQRYATLVSNKRQVLKSVLDEEVFKWVWRTTFAFLMSNKPERLNFSNALLSTGLPSIPPDAARATTPEKVIHVGEFLLSKALSESHLRFPLVFYFNIYCRHIQQALLAGTPPKEVEKKYDAIVNAKREDGVSDMLVAIDRIMNTTGNSGASIEDVLQHEDEEIEKFIPPAEMEFVSQFRDFTRGNITASMKKLLPKARDLGGEEGGASLMPLLLVLRTLPTDLRQVALDKLPGPFLNMFLIRMSNTTQDDVAHQLAEQLRATIEARTKAGETYSVAGGRRGQAGVETVQAAQRVEAAPEGQPQAERPADPAPKAEPAPPRDAARTLMATTSAPSTLDQPVILDWRPSADGIDLIVMTVGELVQVAGTETRILLHLIKFALQTGQVFRVPPEKVSRQTMEKLIVHVMKQAPKDMAPLLSKEERLEILESGKQLGTKRLLAMLAEKLPEPSMGGGGIHDAIHSLTEKLGGDLGEFLTNPRQEAFREVIRKLTPEERHAVIVLNRVSQVA